MTGKCSVSLQSSAHVTAVGGEEYVAVLSDDVINRGEHRSFVQKRTQFVFRRNALFAVEIRELFDDRRKCSGATERFSSSPVDTGVPRSTQCFKKSGYLNDSQWTETSEFPIMKTHFISPREKLRSIFPLLPNCLIVAGVQSGKTPCSDPHILLHP